MNEEDVIPSSPDSAIEDSGDDDDTPKQKTITPVITLVKQKELEKKSDTRRRRSLKQKVETPQKKRKIDSETNTEAIITAQYMSNLMRARLRGLISVVQYDNIKYLVLSKYKEQEFAILMRLLKKCLDGDSRREWVALQGQDYLETMVQVLSM
jgi:hypothetical protein